MPPAHIPTDAQREKVRDLAGHGVPHADIALIIGINLKTLYCRYRNDLDVGMASANAEVGGALFRMAVSGDVPAATIFWAKVRMGWSERQVVELTGRNGGPIQHDHAARLAVITDAELARIVAGPEDGGGGDRAPVAIAPPKRGGA